MRTDDQYFQPGDKVMRVSSPVASGYTRPDNYGMKDMPEYGIVYCVEDFWEGPQFNVIMLVGVGGWRYHGGMKVGWQARRFRKVEEIKLCVGALEHTKKPEKQRTFYP